MSDASSPTSPNTPTSNRPIHPVAILLDELKSEDIDTRMAAMNRLPTISVALGPERTMKELIPFLESALEEEDEVLFAMAKQLVNLVEPMGGIEEAWRLVPLLERLAMTEETIVRQQAIESFKAVIKELCKLPGDEVDVYVWPAIQRLVTAKWMSHRQAGASLLTSLLAVRPEEVVDYLLKLARDDSALVKRAAIPELAKLSGINVKDKQTLLNVLRSIAEDPQDSVRMLVIPVLCSLSHEEGLLKTILSLIKQLFLDQSWRVRYMLADTFQDSIQCLMTDDNIDIVGMFIGLLSDQEGEVRAAAASKLVAVLEKLQESSQSSAMVTDSQPTNEDTPNLRLVKESAILCSDSHTPVRINLAHALPHLAPYIGPSHATELLLPLVLRLLRDESSEVRLEIIRELSSLVQVVGMDKLLSNALLPALNTLVNDAQWRVRQAVVGHIPSLATFLTPDIFDAQLLPLLRQCMSDPVWAVRDQTSDILHTLYDQTWRLNSLLPLLNSQSTHPNYLYRITVLSLVERLPHPMFINLLRLLGTDAIPNVRIATARSILHLLPVLQSSTNPETKQQLTIMSDLLNSLTRDSDQDVRWQATQAIHLLC